MSFHEIKAAIDKQHEAFDSFTQKAHARLDEIVTEQKAIVDRIEEIEAKGSIPGKGGSHLTAEAREHKAKFEHWLRNPRDSAAMNALGDFESHAKSVKSISIGSNADGGFALPEEIARDIERLELKFSPVRRIVKVARVSSNDNKHLVSIRGASSGWVGESDSRTETTTPQLRERAPTMGEIYAYPQTSEWALDDVFFDVGAWLAEEVAQEFAQEEGIAVLTGNGSNKPTGMLNTTPVTTADFASPKRAAAAYQYIASLSDDSPPVAEITPDSLITLVYSVNSMYRTNATWTMNSTTAAAIRKLKDSSGQYLWAQSLAAGQPDRLLGYPVEIWENMSDIGTNNFPVAFGDFRRGYLLVDRTAIRITVDSNITTPGKIKYFVRRREGGCPYNNDAVKFLRTTIA